MDIPVLKKFTQHLKNTLNAAAKLALELKNKYINPEHFLYGLLSTRGGIAHDILGKTKLSPELLKIAIRAANEPALHDDLDLTKLKFSLTAKKALEKSVLTANRYKHKYVGTEHLLFSLLELNDASLAKILEESHIDRENLKKNLTAILKNTSKFPDLSGFFAEEKEMEKEFAGLKPSKTPALDFFSHDLTDPALQKSIDPLVGRSQEVERLIHILSRRTKNNPILLGDPGVGKTAIVEGLAKKILKGEVPDVLAKKKILSLDLGMVVAGTIYRGEFESRLKQVIEEIRADENIILFIDEIHNIIGTGSATGSMDAANILKPALAKGQIRCIGATTLEEFKKNIESDPALERRFQPIIIKESNVAETLEILAGVKKNFEDYHHVKINEDALTAAVKLSSRYIQDKFLPDKAIDLIDEAAAKIKVSAKTSPLLKKIKAKEKEREKLEREKEQAVLKENFDEALALKQKEGQLKIDLNKLGEKYAKETTGYVGEITEKDIAEIISKITGVPLAELVKSEKERLVNLEKELGKFIIGQNEATKAIADFIRRSRVGLSHPNRPLGSFIFLGPSGVGKTEMAKVLAKVVFEDDNALIRLDMSEFTESFNISKLIGAPAGYVGYKEGTKLSDQVKRKPYSVVLFDEMEKAHPDVFNLLLQILDEGHLTDAVGKKINFKNTIIIMTSNVGLKNLNQLAGMGFETENEDTKKKWQEKYEAIKNQVLKDLREKFRPEFLNRVDKTIVFKPLDDAAVEKIVELQIRELGERLKEKNITFTLNSRARASLAKKAFSPDSGARAVRKLIQELIENPLAEKILTGEIKEGDRLDILLEKDNIKLAKAK
ncbi:MAG: ATP-dependent Clp protease ATP-binding subunit [Patescibacteria group bacterium]